MLRTFHVPARDLRDGDTVELTSLYPRGTDHTVVTDIVRDNYTIYDGRIWLSFENHPKLNGYWQPDFTFTVLVDVVPHKQEHIAINRHKCSCGWEGDWFSIHMNDVINAVRKGD